MTAFSVRLHTESSGKSAVQLPVRSRLKVLDDTASIGLGQIDVLRRIASNLNLRVIELGLVVSKSSMILPPSGSGRSGRSGASPPAALASSPRIYRKRLCKEGVCGPAGYGDGGDQRGLDRIHCRVEIGRNPSQNIVSCAVSAAVGKLTGRLVIIGSNPVSYGTVGSCRYDNGDTAALENTLNIMG